MSFLSCPRNNCLVALCTVQSTVTSYPESKQSECEKKWLHKNRQFRRLLHYDDVIMSTIASQITSLTIVYSTVYTDADQSKHQSSASLAFVWGIHRGPVNSPHKWPVTRKMFPFDDVIMISRKKSSNVLVSWRTVYAITRISCWCFFPSLLRAMPKYALVNAYIFRHSS